MLAKILKLLDLTVTTPDLSDLYTTLISQTKAHWDSLIENGVSEIPEAKEFSEADFLVFGHLLECPIAKIGDRPATEHWGVKTAKITVSVVFPAELLIQNAFVKVMVDGRSDGLAIRRVGYRKLFISPELISFVGVCKSGEVYLQLRNCISLELRVPDEMTFASYCGSIDLLVVWEPARFVSKVADMWATGKLSTFDYLLSLNILHGGRRSLSDGYPYFPVISERSDGQPSCG
jgi:hypothetical protein